jgi:hypothetical protein
MSWCKTAIRAADASLKEGNRRRGSRKPRPSDSDFPTFCTRRQAWKKRRLACAGAIRFLLRDPQRLEQLFVTRRLPMEALISKTGIPKKLLDRYRKYVIAAVIILSGDYPALSSYFAYIGKEPAL